MKKIIILGSTGMLGNAVGKFFLNTQRYKTFLSYRDVNVSYGENKFYFDPLNEGTWQNIPTDADYIINCIGVIKPFMHKNIANSIYINSIFPHKLTDKFNNVIHITTDCVFSGKTGKYDENSFHDALDEYGKSKSLGECPNQALVLRTSIIGEEIHKNASLIAWAKSQKNNSVNGFSDHFWNGITTACYASICDQIITNNLYKHGLYHIFSPEIVSKAELLQLISNAFDLNLKINKIATGQICDRSIITCKKDLNLHIPSLKNQLNAIKQSKV